MNDRIVFSGKNPGISRKQAMRASLSSRGITPARVGALLRGAILTRGLLGDAFGTAIPTITAPAKEAKPKPASPPPVAAPSPEGCSPGVGGNSTIGQGFANQVITVSSSGIPGMDTGIQLAPGAPTAPLAGNPFSNSHIPAEYPIQAIQPKAPDPVEIAVKQLPEFQARLETGKPLTEKQAYRLADLMETFGPESPHTHTVQVLLSSNNLVAAVRESQKNSGRIHPDVAAALKETLSGDDLTAEQKRQARKLLNHNALIAVISDSKRNNGELSEVSLVALHEIMAGSAELSDKQRGKLSEVLNTYIENVLSKKYPDLHSVEPLLNSGEWHDAGSPGAESAKVILNIWTGHYLARQNHPPQYTAENMRVFKALAETPYLLEDLHQKMQGFYTGALLGNMYARITKGTTWLRPEDFKLLKTVDPGKLTDKQKDEVKICIASHAKTIEDEVNLRGSHYIRLSRLDMLSSMAQHLNQKITESGLGAVAAKFDALAEIDGAKARLAERIESYKDYKYDCRGFFSKLQPRVGPPLNEVAMATYNVQKLDLPDPHEFDAIIALQVNDALRRARTEEPSRYLTDDEVDKLRQEKIALLKLSYKSREQRALNLGNVLRTTHADFIVLQEVQGLQSLKAFLEITGLDKHFPNVVYALPYQSQRNKGKRDEPPGIAVIAKEGVGLSEENIQLLNPRGSARPIVELPVDTGNGNEIYVEAMHLKADIRGVGKVQANCQDVRDTELRLVNDRALELGDAPVIALGDCNMTNPIIPALERAELSEKIGTYQHPSNRNTRSVLDWVFTKGITFAPDRHPQIHVQKTAGMPVPSDHLPVVFSVLTRPAVNHAFLMPPVAQDELLSA